MPISVLYAALGLIVFFILLAGIFSLASARGIMFHSCGGGADFYCNTCPGQYKCPGMELGSELMQKMDHEKGVQK